FGTKPAASFTQVSGVQVQAVSPAGAGTVGVTVATPGGTSGPANFYYLNPPSVTGLTPTAGPLAGGTTVTINGTNLEGATTVTFGGTAGTITAATGSTITVTTPAKATAGQVAIVVTTPGGSTDNLTFTYTAAPTITGVTPSAGTTAGGAVVGITGTNLDTTTRVTFGSNAVPTLAPLTSTKLAVITPAGSLGLVNVTVTNPAGSAASLAYTYI
ncbi:IPT/TIG domain-containing protein, partial [Streptomyces olivoverticillatus]|uniref:IPT/TIG domain-containing protein n=1 Tax=Streptomyces olivoverticillatus TaxID=66427 RepID=UPI001610F9FC